MDGSREMNVPARLAAGERLYRDVVYHYGPAGPWLEAGAISLFGRRFVVLEALGAAAAAVLFFAIARLAARAGSRLAAVAGVTWAAALCVGAPNGGSFLFPYSFDALFALAGAFLGLALASDPRGRLAGAAAAAGLAFALSAKPEIGAAALIVVCAAAARTTDGGRRWMLGAAGGAVAAASLVWAVALAGLRMADLSPEGPLALFAPPREWRAVYRVVSGLADPAGSLSAIATALFLDLAILAAVYAAARASRRTRAAIPVFALGASALVLFLLSAGRPIEGRLPALLAPMPLVAPLAALWLWRRPLDSGDRAAFLLLGFSGAIASRVVLGLTYGAITTPYAIFAVPGLAAAAAVIVCDRLPQRLGAPPVFRTLAAGVMAACALFGAVRWRLLLPPENALTLRTPAGSLALPGVRAVTAKWVLAFLEKNERPGDTLTGFPEGGFFNFTTGLSNPLRQEQILPGHLDDEAEERAAKRLEERGPRFLLLVNQPAPAFGRVAFGSDYAVGLWRAAVSRYRPVASFGAPPEAPVGDPRFFIRIFERTEPAASGGPR